MQLFWVFTFESFQCVLICKKKSVVIEEVSSIDILEFSLFIPYATAPLNNCVKLSKLALQCPRCFKFKHLLHMVTIVE